MRRATFNQYIKEIDFKGLFITEMGWNRFHGQADIQPIEIDGTEYRMKTIAERNGFQIIICPVNTIPTTSVCRKIDFKLRKNANDYICIFYIPDSEHHQWIAPIKTVEKRDIVTVEYETADKADFLFSKIDALSFDLAETTTIVDVKERIQGTFAVNSEKITKDFYAGFKKEHKAFADFITGIDDHIVAKDNRNKQWYTSVMLNRLMFCYFIQKKGFLDGDFDYLQRKLKWVRKEQGEDRFFKSFYRGFLSELFHDGLNAPLHDAEFERKYGRIPYLNGGMFDEHQLEHDYADIDISDEAFIRLFNFFDTWRWHLDTRITASGKDINPDVLGYIFEQYINDRAQMGAYYTKEDITEYIGKNCIIPFLMDKTAQKSDKAFTPNGFVWQSLRKSGDRYIYDAVKKGYSEDWQQLIPENIAIGVDTTLPNLLERRSAWNTKTAEKFALPTEIWRETIERLQRCESILNKIQNGEITHINDFITYNLDIRSFVYDLLHNTDDHLFVLHLYKALQNVTILDPTCGSGAFLFAAMNILEPLYEVCIERMQEFNVQNPLWFKAELEEISNKYRSNIQYFIFKSIILRNLYGVDIMVEATEIAKLRLFLKMVAVVEVDKRADNLGLDPLPDIDFNIRCGNTLVGYATEEELNNDLTWGDMFANAEFKEKVESEMQLVSMAYDTFKYVQLNQGEDMAAFKQAKGELKQRLASLNDTLNRRMHAATQLDYEDWLKSHQPFHWLAEFYQIIKGNGGFDVIIGNPPYVEYTRRNKETGKSIAEIYQLHGYMTINCSNLYAFVTERSIQISKNRNNIGFIVPLTIASNNNMAELRSLICSSGISWYSHYEVRPAKLFEGAEQRLTIFIIRNSSYNHIFSTSIQRWHSEHRYLLFQSLKYAPSFHNGSIWRTSTDIETSIYRKFQAHTPTSLLLRNSGECIHYRTAGVRYWIIFLNKGFDTNSLSNKFARVESLEIAQFLMAVFNSNLFWWYYALNFDMFNLKDYMIFNFKLNYNPDPIICALAESLEKDMDVNKIEQLINSKTRGEVITSYYQKKHSKLIIDKIDNALAKHYGFNEEELDFIINYDIKYRMGDELNE
ncbi:MAG: Eco57I restriction-modification methylase domain-containing protein [Alphaproteobacteria bacterium]|nr:Eco57I restriction-modification methylase domain-containing protein [Alphaproteobacteria bacterium]